MGRHILYLGYGLINDGVLEMGMTHFKHNFTPKKHKYNARKTVVDGITFDSKKEAARYEELKLLKAAGEVLLIQLQIPFLLPGVPKRRYLLDFQVFWADGHVSFEDVKGRDTDMSKLKRTQVLDLYGVEIELL